MTRTETAVLYGTVAAIDNRPVRHSDIHAWHACLADVPFDTARAVAVEHYRTSRDLLEPSHLSIAVA